MTLLSEKEPLQFFSNIFCLLQVPPHPTSFVSHKFSNKTSIKYVFISEPEDCLLCCICLDLASQPKQCEDCGKLFCTEFIEWEEALSKL